MEELFVEIFVLNLGLYLGYIIRYVDDAYYSLLSTGFMTILKKFYRLAFVHCNIIFVLHMKFVPNIFV